MNKEGHLGIVNSTKKPIVKIGLTEVNTTTFSNEHTQEDTDQPNKWRPINKLTNDQLRIITTNNDYTPIKSRELSKEP